MSRPIFVRKNHDDNSKVNSEINSKINSRINHAFNHVNNNTMAAAYAILRENSTMAIERFLYQNNFDCTIIFTEDGLPKTINDHTAAYVRFSEANLIRYFNNRNTKCKIVFIFEVPAWKTVTFRKMLNLPGCENLLLLSITKVNTEDDFVKIKNCHHQVIV